MIRPLLHADIERIKTIDALCFAAGEQYDDGVYQTMPGSGQSIVAVNGGTVVGYAFVQSNVWGADLHVRSVAVHPHYQRQGYGEALLRAVIARSFGSVDLLVDESNETAITLYRRLGFIAAEICSTTPPRRRMILHSSGSRL